MLPIKRLVAKFYLIGVLLYLIMLSQMIAVFKIGILGWALYSLNSSKIYDKFLKFENLPVIVTGRKWILSVTHEIVLDSDQWPAVISCTGTLSKVYYVCVYVCTIQEKLNCTNLVFEVFDWLWEESLVRYRLMENDPR